MKIIAMVHGYPPVQNAGAEWMLHEMLTYLKNSGHSIEVLLPISSIDNYVFENIQVSKDHFSYTNKVIKECDLVISHLDRAGKALNYAEFYRKKFVFVCHNTNYTGYIAAKHREKSAGRFAYVIYNSLFTRDKMRYPNPSIVVHPPVDEKRYKVKRGKKITLINLFHRKGSMLFYDIARMMPDYEFLAVEGGYGRQEKVDLPNVTYMANTSDARKIYSQTRILLMPSLYESYGRTGVEAMVSGIPVIASPTPGLQESLGDAGIFCSPESKLAWIDAIKSLDNQEEYDRASKRCQARYKEIAAASKTELDEMERFLMDILFGRI